MTLATDVYSVTARWPAEEKYGLSSQVRRSAASVAANIAEGHGRQTAGAFVQFLRIAQGSLRETETHLELARRVGIDSKVSLEGLLDRSDTIGRMLNGLIASAMRAEPRTTNSEPPHHG